MKSVTTPVNTPADSNSPGLKGSKVIVKGEGTAR
jgi:hypothetical protein